MLIEGVFEMTVLCITEKRRKLPEQETTIWCLAAPDGPWRELPVLKTSRRQRMNANRNLKARTRSKNANHLKGPLSHPSCKSKKVGGNVGGEHPGLVPA
jgi:hypothetical protein